MGNKQEVVFQIINIGPNPLTVSNVKHGCHCTVPSVSNSSVNIGDTLNIEVKYENNVLGIFKQNILVELNSKKSPILLILEGRAFDN